MRKEGDAAPDPSRRLGAALEGMERWAVSYTVSKESPESFWGSVGRGVVILAGWDAAYPRDCVLVLNTRGIGFARRGEAGKPFSQRMVGLL